jgi:glycosyltransferase involved in cell wall biosynthesis
MNSEQGPTSARTILVVPCFNEAARWKPEYWDEISESGKIELLFVNDGSSDATAQAIQLACDVMGSQMVNLSTNVGKGEALRAGLTRAIEMAPGMVGYLDADGAFPAAEVIRLEHLAADMVLPDHSDYDAVWSSRILLAGRDIRRRPSRHYIGRAVATAVAPIHRYGVYDTQSGFKIFRCDHRIGACVVSPLKTRWFPDIELLMRWEPNAGSPMRIWEEPVTGWHDVAGSKMNRSQYPRLLRDFAHLYRSRA